MVGFLGAFQFGWYSTTIVTFVVCFCFLEFFLSGFGMMRVGFVFLGVWKVVLFSLVW